MAKTEEHTTAQGCVTDTLLFYSLSVTSISSSGGGSLVDAVP